MKLSDLLHRTPIPTAWSEGEKIPWHEPSFSQRMLREHLDQSHDAASRRLKTIERHVEQIHSRVLRGRSARILDLGCGPGFYTSRLARLGHYCVGLDFSPASIGHAREEAKSAALDCRYLEGDLRTIALPDEEPFDLVMLLFGELNTFCRDDAEAIFARARERLSAGGALLLEPHTFEAVRAVGRRGSRWYTRNQGLFSERPHLCLEEAFWDETASTCTQRWHIVDLENAELTSHAGSMQAYKNDDYRTLLELAGFSSVEFWPALTGRDEDGGDLCAIVARRSPEQR